MIPGRPRDSARLRLLLLVLVGCGGGDPAAAPDARAPLADAAPGPRPDARPLPVDAATVACPPGLPESFGNLGQVNARKNTTPINPDAENPIETYNVFVDLDDDPRWFFAMNLHPGRGVFSGGVKPGRYELSGADADFQYCAACLSLFADEDGVDGGPSLHMFAAKGILTIDSVVGDEVSGSVEDVLLSAIRIVYDEEGVACDDVEDPICVNTICLSGRCGRQVNLLGCDTSISQMSF